MDNFGQRDGGERLSDPVPEGAYPKDLETWGVTKSGLKIFLRPIKPDDGTIYKAFLQSLSDLSVYQKFFRHVRFSDDFVGTLADVDYVHRMVILALTAEEGEEKILGMARYSLDRDEGMAEAAFAVRDDYQNRGIGRELLFHLTKAARKRGLKGFTAQVMVDNRSMLHLFRLFEGKEFKIKRRMEAGIFYLEMEFL
jgi:GNAT superfamily N-acetyltransferase